MSFSGARRGVFPLPSLASGPASFRPTSRRCQQRLSRRLRETDVANGAITALNVLHSGKSTAFPQTSYNPSLSSFRAVASIQESTRNYVSRVAAHLNGPCDDNFSTQSLLASTYSGRDDAQPIRAAAVSLPSSSGGCDLIDFLPEELRSLYATPNPALFGLPRFQDPDLPPPQPPPTAFLVESDQDYVDLVLRMRELSMLTFTTKPKVINGLFALPKDGGKQRLLFDGRPVNAFMAEPPPMKLCTPDYLARLEVPEGERLFVFKEDVDNYYHRLRVPEWMHPYLALPPVRAGDLGLSEFPPDQLVYPCCTTLPMGWSHAPGIAQAVHEFIADNFTSLKPADRICDSSDFLLDRPRHSLYIDDCAGMALERHLPQLIKIQQEYQRVMDGIGLTTKASKRILPSCDGVEVVGINIDGKRLTAGMAPIKLFRLVEKTRALLGQGFATGKQIERLVGSWSWAFLARRAAFSVFSSVYRFCESAHRSRFQIWPSVNRELSIACALAPLLSTSLASPWFPKVIASDASTLAQGVCAAPRSVLQLRAMANTPPPQVAQKGIPMDRSLHRDLHDAQWSTIVSAPFSRKEHINVLELRALRTAVRWVASSPLALGSRVMSWVDSLVVMYGVRKGRFSSFDLLGQMRPLSALLLAMDISLTCNWIPTDHNPADAPSRDPLFGRKFDSTLGYPGEGGS